jgi:hypothetical protein
VVFLTVVNKLLCLVQLVTLFWRCNVSQFLSESTAISSRLRSKSLHARASPTALWAPMSLPLVSSDVLVGKAEMRRSNQGSRRIDSTCYQLTKAWSYIGQILTGWMFDALLSLYEHTIFLWLNTLFHAPCGHSNTEVKQAQPISNHCALIAVNAFGRFLLEYSRWVCVWGLSQEQISLCSKK